VTFGVRDFNALYTQATLVEPGAESSAVLHVREVPFVDSSGLGALVGGIRGVRDSDGTVAVCCTSPSVLRLLAITGVDRAVAVTATPDEVQAVIAAGRRPALQP